MNDCRKFIKKDLPLQDGIILGRVLSGPKCFFNHN